MKQIYFNAVALHHDDSVNEYSKQKCSLKKTLVIHFSFTVFNFMFELQFTSDSFPFLYISQRLTIFWLSLSNLNIFSTVPVSLYFFCLCNKSIFFSFCLPLCTLAYISVCVHFPFTAYLFKKNSVQRCYNFLRTCFF